MEFGIPSPVKPPVNPAGIFETEVVTDRYIFRCVFHEMQSFLPILMFAFTRSISAGIRDTLANFITGEMKLYSEYLEYGMFKGWINVPPAYRV
ncbi:MAG: hypothetical protein AB1500_05785 [Bacillota bacterium]